MAVCRREPGSRPGALNGKAGLQENNEVRMVPEKHHWALWAVSEHCAFSKGHHSQGTAPVLRTRSASSAVLHRYQSSVMNNDLALSSLPGFLVFKVKCSMTFVSLDAKTTETKSNFSGLLRVANILERCATEPLRMSDMSTVGPGAQLT